MSHRVGGSRSIQKIQNQHFDPSYFRIADSKNNSINKGEISVESTVRGSKKRITKSAFDFNILTSPKLSNERIRG